MLIFLTALLILLLLILMWIGIDYIITIHTYGRRLTRADVKQWLEKTDGKLSQNPYNGDIVSASYTIDNISGMIDNISYLARIDGIPLLGGIYCIEDRTTRGIVVERLDRETYSMLEEVHRIYEIAAEVG